jgi:8-oxo-dGTP pyrophosphatase MutT (NUDIX family)
MIVETSEAIPAATLIAVRERQGGSPELLMPELLMVERAEGMAFAGGALVFPGGRIDEEDSSLAGQGFAGRVAAIRECIEETAVPVALSPVPGRHLALELQRALLDDEPFAGLLERHGLELDVDALVPFARWVPKFHATRRFDTLFFIARAPGPHWQPSIVEGECSAAFWITAREALERDGRGEARLIFPTRRNLERIALHDSFDALAADAIAHSIEPISPWVEERDGENFVTIPEGIGYPVTREKLDGLWRG